VIDDVDVDGRPDLWVDVLDRVEAKDPEMKHSSYTGKGFELHRSLPDGTFSSKDPIARKARF
jgi:hypothetical protein